MEHLKIHPLHTTRTVSGESGAGRASVFILGGTAGFTDSEFVMPVSATTVVVSLFSRSFEVKLRDFKSL